MNLIVNNQRTSPYAAREGYRGNGFGYASDMIHIAVNRDDAEAFMRFLKEIGGVECETLIAGSVVNYAAIHGATECVKALFAAGAKPPMSMDYYLQQAEKPAYGPRARRESV